MVYSEAYHDGKQQILIIDDDPNIRKTLSDILRVKGYEPLMAKNGAEMLELFRRSSVNLVIIDLGLPDMSGLEVLDRVKAARPTAEAIILTGNASLDSAIDATNKGAFSYLLKPYEMDQLLLHIRRALEKHEAEEALILIRKAVESSGEAIGMADPQGSHFYQNKAFLDLFEYSVEELNQPLAPTVTYADPEVGREVFETIMRGVPWMGETIMVAKSGRRFPVFLRADAVKDDNGNIIGLIVVYTDITERKRMEESIQHMAYHDSLTGLPNRKLFSDRLDIALAQSRRNQEVLGIAMLDLDTFKDVNDNLGHAAGDLLFQEVARRIKGALRKGDTVARLGGDEFALIIPALKAKEDALRVARKVADSLRNSILIDSRQLTMTMSIGVATCPEDGTTETILLKNADKAMYEVKQAGRNGCRLYKEA